MSCIVELSLQDGTSLATTNPFKIAAELRRLVGEVGAARPNVNGNLTIKTKDPKQTGTLLQQDLLLERPAIFNCPDRLNSVEAYAFSRRHSRC